MGFPIHYLSNQLHTVLLCLDCSTSTPRYQRQIAKSNHRGNKGKARHRRLSRRRETLCSRCRDFNRPAPSHVPQCLFRFLAHNVRAIPLGFFVRAERALAHDL
jgi:hypothetical protein